MQDGEMEGSESGELREQDRFLPIANVARIMKKGIPSQGKIAKDARECVQECVSEFISFITSEASDRCQAEKVSHHVIALLLHFMLNTMFFRSLDHVSYTNYYIFIFLPEKDNKRRGHTFCHVDVRV